MTAQTARRRPRDARRGLLEFLFRAALDALDPDVLIDGVLRVPSGRTLALDAPGRAPVRLPIGRGVIIVGAGKGAAGLAAAVERRLGSAVHGGVVVVPPGSGVRCRAVEVRYGGHPEPTARSVDATRRVLRAAGRAGARTVLVLLTGGASTLLVAPAPGISLGDKRRMSALLLASGASIDEINAVRKHLSVVKGGALATRLLGRRAAALVLSDVPGDDLSVIGSGPTVGDPTTFAEALDVLSRRDIAAQAPAAVRRRLARGARGVLAETPAPGAPAVRRVPTLLLGGNDTARAGVRAAARRLGLGVRVVRTPLTGPTRVAAARFARRLVSVGAGATRPTVVVAGGETTVTLGPSPGRGGRNQEFALEVARALGGRGGWALLSVGTDGIDGPTDAAGAYVDAETVRRAGRSLPRALARHDAYPLLRALGDLVRTGPTGTNVADLKIGLVWKNARWRPPRGMIEPGPLPMRGQAATTAGSGGSAARRSTSGRGPRGS